MAIVRQHLLEGVPVSKVCEEHRIRPTQFYQWQKQLFERGPGVFEKRPGAREKQLEREVERLRVRLAGKDEVIAGVSAEFVK